MKEDIIQLIKDQIALLGVTDVSPEVTVPENPDHGDYSTNIAMKVWPTIRLQTSLLTSAHSLLKSPMDLALQVRERLMVHGSQFTAKRQNQNSSKENQTVSWKTGRKDVLQDIERVEVVAPGFINFYITDRALITQVYRVLNQGENVGTTQVNKGKTIMVEFAHPNTHKAFHIGHLRNITTGESIVRLLESTGYKVIRANYQGDVGMHIAKCLYGILKVHSSQFTVHSWEQARALSLTDRVEYLGQMYAAGSKAYDDDPEAKKAIGEINKQIYAKDPSILDVYQETRQWSLDYFEGIYKRVGSHFDRYYFEGEVYEAGKQTVLEGLKKGIFEESEGAIIFPGEQYGLHTRVFITKEGNPTYEGKDMGLGPLEFGQYHPEKIIHVVGPEQASYFQVLFEALAQLYPETRGKEYHLIYGWVKLKQGKMSSRSGNVVLGEWLLDEAKKSIYTIVQENISKDTLSSHSRRSLPRALRGGNDKLTQEEIGNIAEKAAVAAVKYSFLHVGTESEIAFDLASSVNMQGDSGPYLQYTYARCKSVLRKAGEQSITYHESRIKQEFNVTPDPLIPDTPLHSEERALARLLVQFPDVVSDAASGLSPSLLCTYLFHLAQAFNLFYAKHSILGDVNYPLSTINYQLSTKTFRLSLTQATATILARGLYLLGIETLEQM